MAVAKGSPTNGKGGDMNIKWAGHTSSGRDGSSPSLKGKTSTATKLPNK